MLKRTPFLLVIILLLVALRGQGPMALVQPRYDLLIAGGQVVDGTGAPPRRADVAIRAGRIVEIGTLAKLYARDVIDATGLVVAPGFIDVHTHADDLVEQPRAENFVRMGVTTIVAGNCGSSSLDVGKALTAIEQAGAAVNFATLIGHNTVRREVMGTASRNPTISELDRMKSLVWRAMADGAVGFSTGLQYVPGTYAQTGEIIELARVAGNEGGVYASHMRNEGTALEAGGHGDDSRRRDDRVPRPDFPSQGRQPEPLGRQREGAGARSTRRASAGIDRRGRPVRVHGRQLDARHPVSVLGARRWAGADHRAAE